MQDVDIEDQIRNAQFMYPEKPWRSISREAVTCIQRCLVVSHETRYTVDQALADTWLAEDEQCGRDLATLEEEVTIRPDKRGHITTFQQAFICSICAKLTQLTW